MHEGTTPEYRPPVRVGRLLMYLAIYVLSWGPTAWLGEHMHWGGWFETFHILVFYPLHLVYNHGPTQVQEAMRWYLIVGAPKTP